MHEAAAMIACPFCGKPIDPTSDRTWRRVEGWERKAPAASTRRGGSDIALREPLDEYAHDRCIQLAKAGVSAEQMTL